MAHDECVKKCEEDEDCALSRNSAGVCLYDGGCAEPSFTEISNDNIFTRGRHGHRGTRMVKHGKPKRGRLRA